MHACTSLGTGWPVPGDGQPLCMPADHDACYQRRLHVSEQLLLFLSNKSHTMHPVLAWDTAAFGLATQLPRVFCVCLVACLQLSLPSVFYALSLMRLPQLYLVYFAVIGETHARVPHWRCKGGPNMRLYKVGPNLDDCEVVHCSALVHMYEQPCNRTDSCVRALLHRGLVTVTFISATG